MRAAMILIVVTYASPALAQQSPPPRDVVDSLTAAFNRHDVATLDEWVHPNFVWFNVDSTGAHVEVNGLDALRDGLSAYYAALPTVRVVLEGGTEAGPFVSVVERVSWTRDGEVLSQASTAVYEVRDGKVRRVWYYPEVR